MIVYFKGEFMPAEDAVVGAVDPAFTHGPNVYETVRGYRHGKTGQVYLFRLGDHVRRFQASMRTLRYPDVPDAGDIAGPIVDCARKNELREDFHVRVHAFSGSGQEEAGAMRTDLLVIPAARPAEPVSQARARIASWRRPSDDSLPSRVKAVGNRMFARVAAAEARADGYDQIILLNDRGKLAEALSSNLFIVRGSQVSTPSVTSGILEGITRATILDLLRGDTNYSACEREIDRSELYGCDEAFLTSTGLEIVPVVSVDGMPIGDGGPGRLAGELLASYDAIKRGRVADRMDWLTPVYP